MLRVLFLKGALASMEFNLTCTIFNIYVLWPQQVIFSACFGLDNLLFLICVLRSARAGFLNRAHGKFWKIDVFCVRDTGIAHLGKGKRNVSYVLR